MRFYGPMAILTIKETWDDRGTDIGEDALVNRTRTWRVTLDDPQTSDFDVIEEFSTTTGIRRFTAWQSITGDVDPTCRAVSLSAKQAADAWSYDVTVRYSTIRAGSAGGGFTPSQLRERAAMARENARTGQQPQANPTLRPPVYNWGSQEYQEALRHDAVIRPGGKMLPVANSAFELFDPVPMRTLSVRTLTIERNTLTYDPLVSWNYENKVNSEPVTIRDPNGPLYVFPALTALCKSWTGTDDYESGIPFTKETIVIHFRADGWLLNILDAGLNERRPDGKLTPIRDQVTASNATKPVPLDGQGRKLVIEGANTKFVFLGFNQYEQLSFAPMNL